jgi:cold shock CspA family protein
MRGTVARFDEEVGLGTVAAEDGRSYPFHCTALADGTRTVPEGASVRFDVVPGHLGRWEATAVERA